jgi:pimeloyl-ACP methyl ester carboxylesterase
VESAINEERSREMAPVEVALDAGSVELSGLLIEPEDRPPRATIVCLHGGGMSASYFHAPADPSLSLLSIGAAAGFAVLSLDRPGYARSGHLRGDAITPRSQAHTVADALRTYSGSHAIGSGFVLVGHSFGVMVATWLAATCDVDGVIGLASSGLGIRFALGRRELLTEGTRSELPRQERRTLQWGDDRLYPPNTFTDRLVPLAKGDVDDRGRAAGQWPDVFPTLAPKVTVPVDYVLGEHELWYDMSEEALSDTRAFFSAAPFVDIAIQRDTGHNISLSLAARAYHLRVLAFAENCRLVANGHDRND